MEWGMGERGCEGAGEKISFLISRSPALPLSHSFLLPTPYSCSIPVPFLLLPERMLQSLFGLFTRVVNVGAGKDGLVLGDRVIALSGQVVNLGGSEEGECRQVGVGAFRFRDFQEMLSLSFIVFA